MCGPTYLADDALVTAPPTSGRTKVDQKRGDDPFIGRELIGQYVIRERIGDGGMGAVYRAEQPSVGRDAAIKVLHPSLSSAPGMTERFQQEARAASQLNHPHIVTIYNYGSMDDGTLFLAMEYLDGVSLQKLVARGPLPPERAVRIAAQIADSLDEAHRNGVVHRDLKPHNVMIVQRGQQEDFVKVLDFGIAKVQGVDMTSEGLLCGTPRYMSPEQLRGEKVDGRSDLYAVGVVLFEMLAGRTPFEADSILGFAHKHMNEPPPSLSEVARRQKVPKALEDLVQRLLAKDPADRPQSAGELSSALATAMEEPEAEAVTALARPAPASAPIVRTESAALVTTRRAWRWLAATTSAAVSSVVRGARALVAGAAARIARLRKRSVLERLGLRRSPTARAGARARRVLKDARSWLSSKARRLRKR